MTIKRLIGSAPSQVSRNKDLGSLAFQNKDAPRFDTLTIDGAVGIGTTTPSYALDVFPVSGSSNSIIRAYGPSIARLSLQNSTRHYSMSVQSSSLLIYDETGGATRASLLSTGEFTFANGITPQYYNEQTLSYPTIRPTLNLDFAGSESVDSRITFTRASSATYYGADGKLKYAAQNEPRIDYNPATGECKGLLVEEQRTNIATYSDSLQPGYFGLEYGAYLRRASGVAPDGSFRANLLCADGTNTTARLLGTLPSAGTYTTSFYTKQGASSRSGFWVYASGWVMTDDFTWTNGAPVSSQGSPTIVYVGNGWYRMSYTYTVPSAGTILFTPSNYTAATASSSTWFWGIQTEAGSFATSHIPTTESFTSRASSATYFDSTGTFRIAGTNQARYGYAYDSTSGKWVSQGLILESASTNYWPESTKLIAWLSTTISLNYASAPDGSNTAWKAVMTNYNAGAQNAGWSSNNAGTVTGRTFTYSVWLRSESGTMNMIISIGRDSMNPTVEKLISVDTTWRRYEVTATLSGGTTWFAGINTAGSGQSATVLGWGSQVEEVYVATSYIPTYGAAATRAADVSSSAATTRIRDDAFIYNVDKLGFNYDEGALYAEGSWSSANSSGLLSIVPGNTDNWSTGMMMLGEFNSGVTCGLRIFTSIGGANATAQIDSSFAVQSVNTYHKMSGAWKTNDAASVIDSLTVFTDSSVIPMPNLTTFKIGSSYNSALKINGTIKKIVYYPKRISNAQLQALTA